MKSDCNWVSVNLSDALGDKLDFIVTQFNEKFSTAGDSRNVDTHVLVLDSNYPQIKPIL